MKIYSWNVYCYNRRREEVCAYIRKLDFDVLCLQEVTPKLLECLKEFPYEIVYHTHVIRFQASSYEERNYVVLLSKLPIRSHGTLDFADLPLPAYLRGLVRFLHRFRWSLITERGSVYADVLYGDIPIRVFSTHLTLWGPGNRAEEFSVLMKHVLHGMPTVIAGDFNVIEYGPMKIASWILGAPIREALPWYPERALFEERFRKYGFVNPHRKQITHGFSRSQLDHVLVSRELSATRAWVDPELHGSDHYPVGAELELATNAADKIASERRGERQERGQ